MDVTAMISFMQQIFRIEFLGPLNTLYQTTYYSFTL